MLVHVVPDFAVQSETALCLNKQILFPIGYMSGPDAAGTSPPASVADADDTDDEEDLPDTPLCSDE